MELSSGDSSERKEQPRKKERLERIMQHLIPSSFRRKDPPIDDSRISELDSNMFKLKILMEIYRTIWISILILSVLMIIKYMRRNNLILNFSKFVKLISQLKNGKRVLNSERRHYLYLIEPLIATAMMSSFSVVYSKFKRSIMLQVEDIEIDLIIFNRMTGIIKSIIRKECETSNPFSTELFKEPSKSHEEVIAFMIEKDKETYPSTRFEYDVKITNVDEFMKCVEVIAYHPKTGQAISQKVLIPRHPNLGINIDDLKIDMLSGENSQTPPTISPTLNSGS